MRFIMILSVLVLSVACSPVRDLDGPTEPLGDFRLGFNVVQVAPDVTKGPVSRDVTTEEWKAGLKPAFDRRFSRFDGAQYYHLGINVLGYVVARAGIPVIASPKSVLIFEIVVVDNDTQKPIGAAPERFTVIETLSGANVFGSGLTSSKEEQIADLANAAAKRTERWLREQPWFYRNDPIKQAELQGLLDAKTDAQ